MSSDTSSVSDHKVELPSGPLYKQQVAQKLVRASTQDTEITEHSQHPNISVFCERCDSFVAVHLLQAHRAYHEALKKLEYRGRQRPDGVKRLTERRQQILHRLTKSPGLSTAAVQKVNNAYQLLKAYLEDTYEDLIQVHDNIVEECHGLALNCSAACAHAVGICSDANQRWKPNMEDTRVFQDYYGNDINKCFFAIYDGYSGRFAADIAANDLHHILLNEMSKFDPSTKCTCTVNLAGCHDLTDYKLDRRKPVVRKESIRHILHEESQNIIRQIMHTCEDNVAQLNNKDSIDDPRTAPLEINRLTPTDLQVGTEDDSFDHNVEDAFRQAYRMTDYTLSYGIDETSRVRWSGCSAVSCIIHNFGPEKEEEEIKEKYENCDDQAENNGSGGDSLVSEGENQCGMLYLANAGNCHAVLCRKGKAERLTQNHTLYNNYEKLRVKKAGASVQGDGRGYRVNGVLDTTRGLGNHGDPVLKAAVAAEPYTTSIIINSETEFLILASPGVWAVLTDNEAVSILVQMLPGQDVPPCSEPGEDDFLERIKEHSKNMIAKLVDGFDELGIETNLDVQIPGYQNENIPENPIVEQNPIATEVTRLHRTHSSEKVRITSKYVKQSAKEEMPSTKPHPNQTGHGSKEQSDLLVMGVSSGQLPNGESKVFQIENRRQVISGDSCCDNQNGDLSVHKEIQDANVAKEQIETVTNANPDEDTRSDMGSEKTDFESFISSILENDNGNEVDMERVTELQSIYAHSRMTDYLTRPDMYCNLAQAMSKRLVQSALWAGSRNNITAMVILLPGCKI